MANETRGILFEAIAEQALVQAIELTEISGQLFWNKKPEKMSITPDFSIGKNEDEPDHIILVTAVGSARNAEMKSWRNLGEFYEAKVQIPNIPIVVSVYFKSEVKKGLSSTTKELYDSSLNIENYSYHNILDQWVSDNLKANAKTKEAKRELLIKDLQSNSQLASAIASLAEDLADALQQRNTELEPLWVLMKQDYEKPHHPPESKKTYIRRGLGKLMVIEAKTRQAIYQAKGKSIDRDLVPDYAYEIGFFKKSLAGAHIADSEIRGALELLGGNVCESILQQAPQSMYIWIEPLRNLGNVYYFTQCIINNYENLITTEGMEKFILNQHQNPSYCLDRSKISGNLNTAWIFDFIGSLEKAKTKKSQGFGFAYFSQHPKAEHQNIGNMNIGTWCSCFMNQFFNRLPEFTAPVEAIKYTSELLSEKLSEFSKSQITELSSTLKDVALNTNLEKKLLSYRNFEPLMWLLIDELNKQGKAYEAKRPYVGWINEYTAIGKRSATTPFVKVGSTLVHWKTVSDAGRGHKKKELAARARSVKYQYHANTKTFTRRKGIKQLALIVDGTFLDEDLKILAESGWDIIVYPDQISDLVTRL